MATVNTNDLRIKNAKNLVQSMTGVYYEQSIVENPTTGDCQCEDTVNLDDLTLSQLNNAYVFTGRSMRWDFDRNRPVQPGTLSGDEVPPTPHNNYQEFYQTYDQMISLKRVQPQDVYHMIPRLTWESGLTYDIYRHDYYIYNKSYSKASNLYDCAFVTINQNRDVYVCLDNNEAAPSTQEPLNTSGSSNPFYTSDGYQWLWMYNLGQNDFVNHTTNNLMPIPQFTTATPTVSLVDGGIYTVIVDDQGEGYVNINQNEQSSIYYCKIVGDGTGAVAGVYVSNGRAIAVRVQRPGSGYTYGTVDFRANHVYESLVDLDADQNALNPAPNGPGGFKSTVIISPPGGWGTDIVRELGGVRVGVFSTMRYNTMDFLPDSQFRQVGILQNIETTLFADDLDDNGDPIMAFPGTLSAYKSVMVTEQPSSEDIDFVVGEEIYQEITKSKDPLDPNSETYTVTARGNVVGWHEDDNYKILSYIQDPQYHTDADGNLYEFEGNYLISTDRINGTNKRVNPDETFSGDVSSVVVDGISMSVSLTFDRGYKASEIQPYSGMMTYLTNLSPVQRSSSQTERISLVISY